MRPARLPARVYFRRRVVVFGSIGALLVLVILASAGALSGSSKPTTNSHPRRVRPKIAEYRTVGVRYFSYTDSSRSTYNYVTGEIAKGRKITVELRYPAKGTHKPGTDTSSGAAIVKRKAYPLIVFAPGYRLRPSDYHVLLDSWVDSGYLVASVEFPNTTYPASEAAYAANLPHGTPETDLYLEPGDLAFAIDSLRASARTKKNWLDGLVNPSELVLAGHSDGGSAAAALVYDSPYADSGLDIDAVAVLSGSEFALAGQSYHQPATKGVPLLVLQSAEDRCEAPSSAVQLYNAIGPPKYLDVLTNASHLGAVDGTNSAATGVVKATTTAFFANSLGIRSVSTAEIASAGTVTGVASLTSEATVAAIPAPLGASSCPAG
jgi:predicted esterase